MKLLFKFSHHPMSVFALPGEKQTKQNTHWDEWKNVDKFKVKVKVKNELIKRHKTKRV